MPDGYFPGGSVADRILNALFITECPVCGKQLPEHGVCDSCDTALEFEETDTPVFEINLGDTVIRCSACYRYDSETVKDLLFYLKRKGGKRIVSYAALKIKRAVSHVNPPRKVVFTNVPRSTAGKMKYGFDQSELLAARTAKMCDNCTYIKLLARKSFSTEQKNLDSEARKKNVKGKFRVRKRLGKLSPDSIVIFDDVITTGSSITECAKLLRKAYPESALYAVFLAKQMNR